MPDLPVLRGSLPPGGLSTTTRNWNGWYVGGQLGYASSEMDFSRSAVGLTDFILRNSILQEPVSQWALLSKNHAQATSFGAFVGRNWQWDDLVFSFEANYTYYTNLQSESKNGMSLIVPGEAAPPGHSYTYNTTLTGSAGLQLKDVITFRGRTGWAVGNALPYVFGGLAVGRVDVSRAATVAYEKYDNGTTFLYGDVLSSNDKRSNSFVPGWTAGLGLEYCLWAGLFLRGEWEYMRFTKVKEINFSANNVRVGVGYKF
jgi:opacity protein-like surface antigen